MTTSCFSPIWRKCGLIKYFWVGCEVYADFRNDWVQDNSDRMIQAHDAW